MATVGQPTALSCNATPTDATCFGASDGSILVSGSGGSGSYEYSIDNGNNWQASGSFTGLAASDYTILVRDPNAGVQCESSCMATVGQPTPVTASLEAACRIGTNDATINIDLTPSGGTGPYTFAWSGPGGQFTTEDLEGVPEGRYYVTVTDANLCTYNTNITQGPCCMLNELVLSLPQMSVNCFNGPTPPSQDDVPEARSETNLLAFLIIDGCVEDDELMISHQLFGPTVNEDTFTFIRIYTIQAYDVVATAEDTFMFTWDPNPPTLIGVPQDIKLSCGSEIPDLTDFVTGYDLEYGEVEVISSESTLGRSCGGYAVQRTWTAMDGCGNTTTGIQMITFEDDDSPVLTVPADTTIYCPGTIPAPYYEAYDACSQYEVDFKEEINYLANGCEYDIVRTWKARDACGNWVMETQIIEFRDTTAPVIQVVNPMLAGIPVGGDMVMYGCMDPQVAMGDIIVTDECCEYSVELNDELIASDACDVFGYYRHWRCSYTATDAAGNVSEFYFNVLQYDTTAPVIHNVPADTAIACDSLIPAVDTTIYVEDDCSASAVPQFSEQVIYDPQDSSKYAIIRTWSASDRCGNRTEVDQIIAVCDFDTSLISANIGSTVWMDDNVNGLQDVAESGINDIEVKLYAVANNEINLIASTTTETKNGIDGQFNFKYVLPGEYQLQFEIPSDLYFTVPNMGEDDQIDSDVDPELGMTSVYSINIGDQATHIDAGLTTEELQSLTLMNFDVITLTDCKYALSWTTMNGASTDRFEIQRSADGRFFEDLSTVIASGGSSSPKLYSFIDQESPVRASYRLKVVDQNGSFFYSETIRVFSRSCADIKPDINIYPNPFKGQTTIEFDMSRSAAITLKIVDQVGKQVKTSFIDSHKGINRQDLDLSDLPEGIYFVQFEVEGAIFNHKLIKIQ